MDEKSYSVSVIVPTLNGARFIGPLLEALQAQSISNEQIIIDSASSDETVDIARSFGARTISIDRRAFDHGATRNKGTQAAKGNIFVFMTQDAFPCDGHLLENLIRPLKEPRVIAAYGRQVPRPDASPPERFARHFNYPTLSSVKTKERIAELGIKAFFFSNVCSAIRKDAFDELGGLPEGLIMDEDLSFAARAVLRGYGIAYAADARVFHSHNYAWIGQFKRYFDTGVFFRDNKWLLEQAPMSSEGMRFVREELRSLCDEGAYQWIIYVLGETFSKYLGYKAGYHYKGIPQYLRKALSMHRGYWERLRPSVDSDSASTG